MSIELKSKSGVTDHDNLSNLNWALAGHTIDANIDMDENNILNIGTLQIKATANHTITDNSDVLEITNPNGDGDIKINLPDDPAGGTTLLHAFKHEIELVPDLFYLNYATIVAEGTGITPPNLLLGNDAVYIGSLTSGSKHKYIQFMKSDGTTAFGSIHAYELDDTITFLDFGGGFKLTGTDLKFVQSTLGVYFGSSGDDGYIIETHDAYSDFRMQLYHDDGVWEFVTDANTDLELRFTGTTNSGKFKWMEDEDYFKFEDDIMLTDGENIVLDTTTGTKIGTATTQKLGFFNATPVTQRLKANYNNWAAFTDIIDALVDLGLFDQA